MSLLCKGVLVFSGKALKEKVGDYSSIETWSSDPIDAAVNEARNKKLLPERRKNITIVGESHEYKPSPNYFLARNMHFSSKRFKKQKHG